MTTFKQFLIEAISNDSFNDNPSPSKPVITKTLITRLKQEYESSGGSKVQDVFEKLYADVLKCTGMCTDEGARHIAALADISQYVAAVFPGRQAPAPA